MVTLKNILRVNDPLSGTYYLGTLYPSQIKELTFVPVVNKSTQADSPEGLNEYDESGYQRSGEPRRMRKIKEFLENYPQSVIPPVLLSARGKWTFEPDQADEFGVLKADEVAAIIDGQHRLGGLWRLVQDENTDNQIKNRPIPFMLIDSIDLPREQQEFMAINDNQQGVKKSLIKYLGIGNNFTADAANALSEEEDSPFYRRVGIESHDDSTIILFGALADCVGLTYDQRFKRTTQFQPDESAENQTKAIEYILEYWNAVARAMPTYWSDIQKLPQPGEKKSREHPGRRKFDYRLLEETGIRAMSVLGSDLFRTYWIGAAGKPSMDDIENTLKDLAETELVEIALTKWGNLSSEAKTQYPDLKSQGKAGVNAIYELLNLELMRLNTQGN